MMDYTLNDVEWREVESPPDRDGPKFMSPHATVSGGKVLIQNGEELIFESVKHLTYYLRSFVDDYSGDVDRLRASLESPDVDVDSLLAA